MYIHFLREELHRNANKSKGFTCVDCMAHIFVIIMFVLMMILYFSSSNPCQSTACYSPKILRIPMKY
jgi:competence protein ComGC